MDRRKKTNMFFSFKQNLLILMLSYISSAKSVYAGHSITFARDYSGSMSGRLNSSRNRASQWFILSTRGWRVEIEGRRGLVDPGQ